jgi:hypothetical protein
MLIQWMSEAELRVSLCYAVLHCAADIDIIFIDKKEAPKAGYVQLNGFLNRGLFGHQIAVCIERHPKKNAILEIKIVSKAKNEEIPPGFVKVRCVHAPLRCAALRCAALI